MKHKLFSFLMAMLVGLTAYAQDIDVEDIQPQLTSVKNITAFFQMNDITYHKDIVNNPENALRYNEENKIAANIGAYLADMVYGLGTKSEHTYKSFGAVVRLADKLDLEDEFTELVIKRINDEDISIEEASEVLDRTLKGSSKNLDDITKKDLYNYIVYGNYIEKLYVVSSLLTKAKESNLPEPVKANMNRNLLLMMAKQSDQLEELSRLMAGNSNQVVAHRDLQDLLEAYLTLAKNKNKILKLSAEDMFSAKEVKNIQKKIAEVRERIVS